MLKIHSEELESCLRDCFAVWPASFTAAGAADVSAGGPVTGYGPYAKHRAAHCLRLPAGRYRALLLVGSLAEPALFPENRQAAKGRPPRTRDGTQEFPAAGLLPFVVVSSVFAPELPPPPNQHATLRGRSRTLASATEVALS